jgi:uncharacterized membrane protein
MDMSENEEEAEEAAEGVNVSGRLLAVLFLGVAFVVVGVVLVAVASVLGGGSASVGGVIFIGPFPIVFGAGPEAAWLIVVSLVIGVLMLALFFVLRRRVWKVREG